MEQGDRAIFCFVRCIVDSFLTEIIGDASKADTILVVLRSSQTRVMLRRKIFNLLQLIFY